MSEWSCSYLVFALGGDEVRFQYKALDGDKLYAEFYDRIFSKPEETVYQTISEGILDLREPLTVIQITEGALKGHFKTNPFWQQNIKTFAREKAEYISNIFPTNSPLVPLFREVKGRITEGGVIDYVNTKWQGSGLPSSQNQDTMVLSGGQTLLIFLIMTGAFGFAFFVYCMEVIDYKLRVVKRDRYMKQQYRKRPKIVYSS